MKNILLAFSMIAFLMICFCANGQSDIFKRLSNVPIQTPDVSALIKPTEIPVGYYNGQPSISIPLYQLVSGDITIPITLNYSASGVRVTDESGWTGLGWTLSANGVVSHEVKGIDDHNPDCVHMFDKIFPNQNGYKFDEFSSNRFHTEGCCNFFDSLGYAQSIGKSQLTERALLDGEPDLYAYNFVGYSGKYFLTDKKYYDVSRSNIRFTNYGRDSIVAQTPDGYHYSFTQTEKSYTNPTSAFDYVVTAYYLTQITSPSGKKVIFKYKSFRDFYDEKHNEWAWNGEFESFTNAFLQADPSCVIQSPSFSEYYVESELERGLKRSLSYTYSKKLYLTKIIHDNGYINFELTPRKDEYGLKLDQINVFRKNGTLFKSIQLQYSYFEGKKITEYYDPIIYNSIDLHYTTEYPENYRKKRLKLTSVISNDERYDLEYYENEAELKLPYKSSLAQDYWGFYNGAGNSTLVPDFRRYSYTGSIPSVFSSWVGAYREPDSVKIKAGMLKRLIYPTRGWSEFKYRINEYENLTPTERKDIERVSKFAQDYNTVGVKRKSFVLTEPTNYVSIDVVLWCNDQVNSGGCANWNCGCISASCTGSPQNALYAYIEKYDPATGNWNSNVDMIWDVTDPEIVGCTSSSSGTGTGQVHLTNYILSAGTYRMVANYPDNKTGAVGSKMANISVSYDTVKGSSSVASRIGGGLRIDRITNFDPISSKSVVKQYTYTGGVMTRFPTFYWNTYVMKPRTPCPGSNEEHSTCASAYFYDYLYSTPIVPISFSANGSLVGYSKVTETINNGDMGKTEYKYLSFADIFHLQSASVVSVTDPFTNKPVQTLKYQIDYVPGIPSTSILTSGFLERTVYYDKSNKKVREIVNTPLVAAPLTYWAFKVNTRNTLLEGSDDNCVNYYCFNLNTCFYPLQLGKLVTSKTVEYNYFGTTSSQNVKEVTYNDRVLVSRETVMNSDGVVSLSEFKYLPDYSISSSGWLHDLSKKNVIGVPIEVLNKVNSNVVSGSFVKYKTTNGNTLPAEIYTIETSVPKSIQSSAPTANISTDFKLKGKIEYDNFGNLSWTQAADDLITSYLWGYTHKFPIAVVQNANSNQIFHTSFEEESQNTTSVAKTGVKGYSAAYTIALPSAGTYKLTYWKKVETAPWQLIEEILSSSKSIGGSGSIIDEVRLYPLGAQMVTYTYDPMVGVTSVTDQNNNVVYYYYDSSGRLKSIKDSNGSLVKAFDYNYQE